MAKLVSNTYGDALFETAIEENRLEELCEEVKAIVQILKENDELNLLMNHPKISKEEKIQMIENIFTNRISRELTGLMRMLVDKGHYSEMQEVFSYFIERVKEHKHIGTAYVKTPMELSEAQKKAIENKLLATTEYVQFEMHYEVDAALIGGMIIRIGDRVVDSSVQTKLHSLTRELSKIQLKVGECTP